MVYLLQNLERNMFVKNAELKMNLDKIIISLIDRIEEDLDYLEGLNNSG